MFIVTVVSFLRTLEFRYEKMDWSKIKRKSQGTLTVKVVPGLVETMTCEMETVGDGMVGNKHLPE